MCWEVLVKFLLKTSDNFEAVIKLEIDISVRFCQHLLARTHRSKAKPSADCVWHSSQIGELCLLFMTQILGMTAILCCGML